MIIFMQKYLVDWSIPSRNTDDQRVLKFDWKKGTTDDTQPILLVSDVAFPWWLTPCKKLRYHLIPSRHFDEQRIPQSDWMRGTTSKPI